MRQCRYCELPKTNDEMHSSEKCRACYAARRSELNAIYGRKPSSRYVVLRRCAVGRGTTLGITLAEYRLICDDDCGYCDGVLDTDKGTGHRLDRLDNSRGYTLDNVSVCCGTCNRIKGYNFTPAETRAAVQAIIALRRDLLVAA